ncbi:MAG: ABC transporter ATP-binding protein [Bacteroidota bacterium]
MSKTVIQVENLSKRYRIGVRGKADTLAGQLKQSLSYPIENFRRITQLNSFKNGDDPSIFWALKGVNFEVQEGEVLGIIGKNGAGKSTLLKVLSKITEPSSGEVKIKGRVSSLLEVGTGFHPELTGRDNVYMNGTIHGMTKKEISKKFEEIVEFAGISDHIDTPVKFYSSGMKVRLGFAVAAHLEPEILIIDEVLAVGDHEFQKKCLGKMGEVSKSGRTVLFVSHNMAMVKNLCPKSFLLEKGKLIYEGESQACIDHYYQRSNISSSSDVDLENHPNRKIKEATLKRITLSNEFGKVFFNKPLSFTIEYDLSKPISNPQFSLILYNYEGVKITSLISDYQENYLPDKIQGKGSLVCKLDNISLIPGKYFLTVKLWQPGHLIDEVEEAISFDVEMRESDSMKHAKYNSRFGILYQNATWHQGTPSD